MQSATQEETGELLFALSRTPADSSPLTTSWSISGAVGTSPLQQIPGVSANFGGPSEVPYSFLQPILCVVQLSPPQTEMPLLPGAVPAGLVAWSAKSSSGICRPFPTHPQT